MYDKGDLQITQPPCAPQLKGEMCNRYSTDMHFHQILDSREDAYIVHPCAFLPHSCDEWVIGGPQRIQALIDDLTAALEAITNQKPNNPK